jgi:predicted DsbA family dithiol-disulfide isomerase
VIHLAAAQGRAEPVVERLLRAYHTEALNIADTQTLARLGAEAGLAAEQVTAMLAGDSWATEVRADKRRAVAHGVTGVPSLVIDGAPPVPGVQPIAELQRLLERAVQSASDSASAV